MHSHLPPINDKSAVLAATEALSKRLYDLLYLMFADGKHSLLVILHGIDASGKDGVVKHIFSSANPQGLKVFSFKRPSVEELHHDFLWRCHRVTPEAGHTVIFNRSYYEEVTTVMVHPELLQRQQLPKKILRDKSIFKKRYGHIVAFEKMLADNGTVVVKFLLDVSKAEQKKRIDERLNDRRKNWKFSADDLKARRYWNRYMQSFKKMIRATHRPHAQWHRIPADRKWLRNYVITQTLVQELEKLEMRFPKR